MRRRSLLILGLAAAALGLAAGPAQAQSYPAKQVRVIVPFAAGGTPDVVARVIAQQLSTQTGQTFVVENRPGADGVVGSQAVAESAPDGYTILVTSSSFVVNPSFHKKMPFDVVRDFEPVTNIAATEAYILGVNPKVPARNVQEFVALARKPESKISFASPGVGNGLHLAAELFKSLTKTQMVHVPYRGAAPALTGLVAGDVQMMILWTIIPYNLQWFLWRNVAKLTPMCGCRLNSNPRETAGVGNLSYQGDMQPRRDSISLRMGS